jgi:hypothetical protein
MSVFLTHYSMATTRKVQVTLEKEEYEALIRFAHRKGKKLTAVVRESVRRYVLHPEADRGRCEALDELLALPPTPVPDDYGDWEQEYGDLKKKSRKTTSCWERVLTTRA